MATKAPTQLEREGVQIFPDYFNAEACAAFLNNIAQFRRHNPLPEIYRPEKKRSLRYSVIDGAMIERELPAIWDLYCGSMCEHVNSLSSQKLVPLKNQQVGVNVNVMPPGRSEYRWHYDRTEVTAILYLNQVEGGETVLYPNYRLLLRNRRRMRTQQVFDRLLRTAIVRRALGRKQVISPEAGKLVVMKGRRCWHSVRGVDGEQERINVILAYDKPGAEFPMEKGLDSYLYTTKKRKSSDPNYG